MKKIILVMMAAILAMSMVSCKKEPKSYVDWRVGSLTANVITIKSDGMSIETIESSVSKADYDHLMQALEWGIIDEQYVYDYMFAQGVD